MKKQITASTEKHAAIIAAYLDGKTWTPMAEVAAHLRQMSNDSMTLRIAQRRVQEAKRFTLRPENNGAVIIASDDISMGRMGYKIAQTPEEIERYAALWEKKMIAYKENITNLDYHKKRLLNREKAKMM